MRALSLKQPYAGLVVTGMKPLETRTWRTKFRGLVLIHASLKLDKRAEVRLTQEGVKLPYACFSRGFIIGIVDLQGCRPMTKEDEPKALCPWSPGRFVWELAHQREIKPIAFSGMLGLFNTKYDLDNIKILP